MPQPRRTWWRGFRALWAPTHSPSSSAGIRCSVPRIAQVLTSVRSSHSARETASRSSPSTRAHRVSSAERRELGVQTADIPHDFERIVTRCPGLEVLALGAPGEHG